VEVLAEKTVRAAKEFQAKQVLVAGGVAANRGLREKMAEAMKSLPGVPLVIPSLELCTDNAAMIAACGSVLFEKGVRADLTLNADPSYGLVESSG